MNEKTRNKGIIIGDLAKLHTILSYLSEEGYKILRIELSELMKMDSHDITFLKCYLATKKPIKFEDIRIDKIEDYNIETVITNLNMIHFTSVLIKDELNPIFIGKKEKFTPEEINEIYKHYHKLGNGDNIILPSEIPKENKGDD